MDEIPTKEECMKLLKEYHVFSNIIGHSTIVANIAKLIATKLNGNGIQINVELVYAAGLLHDIARIVDIINPIYPKEFTKEDREFTDKIRNEFKGIPHAEAGYEILKTKYPKIAKIMSKHGYKSVISDDPNLKPITWEEKVMTYADKRVAHVNIVSLKERFDEGSKRWKKNHTDPSMCIHPEHINKKYFEMEDEIFSHLGIKPEDVESLLKLSKSQ